MSAIERTVAFELRFFRAQATEVVELSWGFGMLQSAFPLSEYHNRIVVTSTVPAAEVRAAADEVLGGAGLRHRFVSVHDDELGQAMTADLVAAGYEHEIVVTMIHDGAAVMPPAHPVHVVSLETLRPAIMREWRVTIPNATDEHVRQLADRTGLYARGADLTLLAVYDGDDIAAHGDLFVDPVDRIAQFENLVTHEDHRGRGYAGALIRTALTMGRDAGSELSFLTAGLDDWPHEWYERLGYVDAGRTHHFSRRP
jgi:GNAT superfamily N-acetyltransferase